MKNIKLFTILFLSVLISACTKVIDIKTGNGGGRMVIEANVTNADGPQVIRLSKSVAFTNTNSYPPVGGAAVTVTDQAGNSFPFTESAPGTYTNQQLKGSPGHSYNIKVFTGGVNYAATSVMPDNVPMDSVTAKNDAFNSGTKPKKEISVHYHDPGAVSNKYRWVLYVNNVQVKAVFAFDDEFNDGLAASVLLRQSDIDIYAGDTVRVEMQCVDKPIYLYWSTLAQQGDSGPGGSVAPSDPPSNITPASLGYFSAHTTQTITIVVK